MKAVMLEGYHKLVFQETDTPKPDGNHVIIKVSKCGICGSDYHSFYDRGDSLKGLILGHEYSGTVEDSGSRADLKIGDRVTVIPTLGCGECDLCRAGLSHICREAHFNDGAYAEYVSCEPAEVVKVPDEVSLVEAAMLEPLAVSVRAVKLAGVYNCAKVLIIGSGIIGATCGLLARSAGATFIALAEANMNRAQKGIERGESDAIFDARNEDVLEQLIKANGGRGYNIVFECSGTGPGMELAIQSVYPGGTIGLVGVSPNPVPLHLRPLVIKENKIQCSYGYQKADFLAGQEMVQRKLINLNKYATKFVALDEVPQTFEDLVNRKIEDTKVIIDVDSSLE